MPARFRAPLALLAGVLLACVAVLVPAGPGRAGTVTLGQPSQPLLPACALGDAPANLRADEARWITQAANAYPGDRRAFAAAAAAYIYGFPGLDLLTTLKGYVHNTLVNVDALATPSTQGVVSPNVDTAYSVAWIDLTQGPLVFSVPALPDRFYTVQFMDAFTNAFAYVGSGSTGTAAGDYAIVPPGWTGSLPTGVHRIQAPTNTLWLLGRTLVNSSADLAQVKTVQAGYRLTPLAAFAAGVREGGLSLSSYPKGRAKAIPNGAAFIGAVNQDLTINPPPPADACLLDALAAAGIHVGSPSPAEQLAADLANIAGVTPRPADNPAVDAGLLAGRRIVADAATVEQTALAKGDHGWEILRSGIGTYGTDYLGRAIVATDYLGANTPVQGLYPTDAVDVDGHPLTGTRDETITFPRGDLPPAHAFWSLTMYGADNYLYANALDRYAIGNRTPGLVRNPDGSLTLHLQHDVPAAGESNWLPAPAGDFHVILRLYEPDRTALDGRWTPPPIFAPGESLVPAITQARLSSAGELTWRDSEASRTRITLTGPHGLHRLILHRDHAGANRLRLALGRARRAEVLLTPLRGLYDTGPGRSVTVVLSRPRS